MGTEIMLDKLVNFLIEDADHEGKWTLTISYPENLPFAIKVLLAYFDVHVIRTGYVTYNHIEQTAYIISSQLEDKNWLNKQQLIPIKNEHEVYYQYHKEINKRRLKHNKQVDKINSAVQKLRSKRTYKKLRKETQTLTRISSKSFDLLLSRLRISTQNTKEPMQDKEEKKKRETIRQKPLCLNQIKQVISQVFGTPYVFFLTKMKLNAMFKRLNG